jgi:hypothetical protein
MLRSILLGLTLLALPACTTIHDQPRPERLERAPEDGQDLLLATFHLGDHASHTLSVVAGPEVGAVWFARTSLDDDRFGLTPPGTAARWYLYARDRRDDREHLVAAVLAHDPTGLSVLTNATSGSSSAVAISVDGYFNGMPEAQAAAHGDLAYALRDLRRAQEAQRLAPPR